MSLLRNSVWNLLGFILPALAIIPAFGVIARLLDIEQFGIFTLCFAVMGYASVFDVGMARAVIRSVAMKQGDEPEVKRIISTASAVVLILSLVTGFFFYIYSGSLVRILSVSTEYMREAQESFELLALAMPAFLLSTVWFAYLEGSQRFYKLNVLKSIYGLLMAVMPLGAVVYQPSLVSSIAGLVLARYLTLVIAYFWSLPRLTLTKLFKFYTGTFKELLGFGGWITVSNLISPIMVYFDRFFISSITGTKDIAFYTTPSEAVSRLSFLPTSVVRVIFPKISARGENYKKDTMLSYWIVGAACAIVSLIGVLGAKYILLIWMGEPYTGIAATVLSILLVGYFFNSLAQVPYAVIQAGGHSKVTALLHMAELIPYIGLLYILIHGYGMIGAAIAWSIRVFIDYLALLILSRKYH
ncbi:flippase [Alcaligenes sp. NLF5-7]|uniref:flippase n=1 Tax=Alcaligenes sp. NLF5-7 TaxID=2918755 RepID=UPI0020C48BED|nr:flippase [Alcaligenes sp. NLF5-7]UTM03733.1 flippase [Alcaligenes sp. NLF5-7]